MHDQLPNSFEDLLRLVRLNGWNIQYSNAGHVKVYDQAMTWVATSSGRSGDPRGILNFRSALKRAGLKPEALIQEERSKRKERPVDTTEYFDPKAPKSEPKAEVKVETNIRHRAAQGSIKSILMEAAATQPGADFSLQDLADAVKSSLPEMTASELGRHLAGYTVQGELVRTSRGRYAMPPKPPTNEPVVEPTIIVDTQPQPVSITARAESNIVTSEDAEANADIKVLTDLLTAMAAAEPVIRRNIEAIHELRKVKEAFSKLGVK